MKDTSVLTDLQLAAVVKPLLTWLFDGAIQATKYVSPTCVVRMTRRRYGGKIKAGGPVEILLHMGRPNYRERVFITTCQKAGEPFPVKRIQTRGMKRP